jgi:hypothetical protein
VSYDQVRCVDKPAYDYQIGDTVDVSPSLAWSTGGRGTVVELDDNNEDNFTTVCVECEGRRRWVATGHVKRVAASPWSAPTIAPDGTKTFTAPGLTMVEHPPTAEDGFPTWTFTAHALSEPIVSDEIKIGDIVEVVRQASDEDPPVGHRATVRSIGEGVVDITWEQAYTGAWFVLRSSVKRVDSLTPTHESSPSSTDAFAPVFNVGDLVEVVKHADDVTGAPSVGTQAKITSIDSGKPYPIYLMPCGCVRPDEIKHVVSPSDSETVEADATSTTAHSDTKRIRIEFVHVPVDNKNIVLEVDGLRTQPFGHPYRSLTWLRDEALTQLARIGVYAVPVEHFTIELVARRVVDQSNTSVVCVRVDAPRELTLDEVNAGADRASKRVDEWPEWKREQCIREDLRNDLTSERDRRRTQSSRVIDGRVFVSD